ncbi:MAG: zinc-ribbon domain-containing protein [Lentisphaerae bacterium]|nr:zinc-ribbon domain-containing protein [Lentisphaerota bacterium]
MKNCPKCNRELRDEAKFCGGCGCKLGEAVVGNGASKCPKCGKILNPGVKFCGACGTKISDNIAAPPSGKIEMESNKLKYICWNVLPGQLAVRISDKDIDSYGDICGLTVQEGIKALLFVDGKVVSELGSGSYDFKQICAKDQPKSGVLRRFLSKIFRFDLPEHFHSLDFVLVRGTEFPLIYEFDNMQTATVSCKVGLHLLCLISNINAFYSSMLLDKKYISFTEIGDSLKTTVKTQLGFALNKVAPESIASSAETTSLLADTLQKTVSAIYPYIKVCKILNISTDNRELDELRQMSEELYIAEEKLSATVKRFDFLNRLQSVYNEQELQGDGSALEFTRRKNKIYEEMALTNDEREKFDLMLEKQRMLRSLKNEDEIDAAVHDLKKTGLFRQEELDDISRQIKARQELNAINDAHLVDITLLQNQLSIDREKLEWEKAVGSKLLEAEINRRRIVDDYEDEKKKRQLDLDRQEQLSQLDILKQAQAIRLERENNEHKNNLELLMAKQNAQLEEKRIYAGMSFEQIMATNPNITPEAAAALAKKFESDSSDAIAKMAIEQRDITMQFMQQQMAMLKDMAVAGMGGNAAHQQELLSAKQAELERTRSDANANNDRFADGMAATIQAVAGMNRNQKNGKVCPQCQNIVAADSLFCEKCGCSL